MRTFTLEIESEVHQRELAGVLARVRLPGRPSYQPFTFSTTAKRPPLFPMYSRRRKGRHVEHEPIGWAEVHVDQGTLGKVRVRGEVRGLLNVVLGGLVAAAFGGAFMQGWIRGLIRGASPGWSAWHWIAILLLGCLFASIMAFGILLISVGVSQMRWTWAVARAAANELSNAVLSPRPARTDSDGGS